MNEWKHLSLAVLSLRHNPKRTLKFEGHTDIEINPWKTCPKSKESLVNFEGCDELRVTTARSNLKPSPIFILMKTYMKGITEGMTWPFLGLKCLPLFLLSYMRYLGLGQKIKIYKTYKNARKVTTHQKTKQSRTRPRLPHTEF